MEVTLSDGEPCEVRRLGLFELRENVKPPLSGPYVFTYTLGGQEVEQEFDFDLYPNPPQRPYGSPDGLPEGSPQWFAWRDYELYQAAVHHERAKGRDSERYWQEVALYITGHCIDDPTRLVEMGDYEKVYHAALAPYLSFHDLETAALYIFRAKFDDLPIFEALRQNESNSDGEHDPIAVWEVQTMTQAGMTESEWGALPLGERARKVVAARIDGWMNALQWEKDKKKNGR